MENLLTTIAILLSILVTSHAQRTPLISFVTANISTPRSSTIDMDCSVLYATEYPVLWMKIGSNRKPIPLSSGSSLIIRDNRFSLRFDTASATYTLQLKDVQRSDESRYECQIIVGINNKVTQSLFLRVLEPPVINDNSTRSVVVDEFKTATLQCTAEGSPKPRIEWRRENNAVLPTGGIIYRGNTLKIHAVKKEDRGTYFCVADNGVGKASKRNVALEVEFPPYFIDDGRQDVVQQIYGSEVALVCSVEAFPPAQITWIHNGIQRSVNDADFQIYKGPGVDGHSVSNLKIRSLTPQLEGTYVCKAGNKMALIEKKFEVMRGDYLNCDALNGGRCDFGSSQTRHSPSVLLILLIQCGIISTAFSYSQN